MLKQVSGTPRSCVCCDSFALRGRIEVEKGTSNLLSCPACGTCMVVRKNDGERKLLEVQVTAKLVRCPHCESVGSIDEGGGFEWCNQCGLDPNEEKLSSPELAHLWHKDSWVQKRMSIGRLKAEYASGKFLREHCGPHCNYEEWCDQSSSSFRCCFLQWRAGEELRGTLFKPAPTNNPKQSSGASSSEVVFSCRRGGWLEENISKVKTVYANQNPTGSCD